MGTIPLNHVGGSVQLLAGVNIMDRLALSYITGFLMGRSKYRDGFTQLFPEHFIKVLYACGGDTNGLYSVKDLVEYHKQYDLFVQENKDMDAKMIECILGKKLKPSIYSNVDLGACKELGNLLFLPGILHGETKLIVKHLEIVLQLLAPNEIIDLQYRYNSGKQKFGVESIYTSGQELIKIELEVLQNCFEKLLTNTVISYICLVVTIKPLINISLKL